MSRLRAWPDSSLEGAASVAVLLLLGGGGFIGSASHVLELAHKNGQTGAGAWTIVGSVEILAAYAGWQVSTRAGWRRAIALVVLALSVAFTISANLASTDVATTWGYTLAVTPAGVFIAAVVLAETQPQRAGRKVATRATPRPAKAPVAVATPVANPVATGVAPVVIPQARVQVAPVAMSPAEQVVAAFANAEELVMGELILATGLARSTAKKAVTDLRDAGRLVAKGGRPRPVYRLVDVATSEAVGVATGS